MLIFTSGKFARYMHFSVSEHMKSMDRFAGCIKGKKSWFYYYKDKRMKNKDKFWLKIWGLYKYKESTMGGIHTIGGVISSWKS